MWDVRVKRINYVKPVENSDKLDVCFIGGWPCVTSRGEFKKDDLAVYIPVDSVLPDNLLQEMNLVGKLAGAQKNRVKAVKLRGQLSIGLLSKPPEGSKEGDDVSEILGIEKYEEVIPAHMSGVMKKHPPFWQKYDIENLNNNLEWFTHGEEILALEKIHGANMSVCLSDNTFDVNSRSVTLEPCDTNLYWKIAREYDLESKLRKIVEKFPEIKNLYIYGEIFGPGVQDLHYGQEQPRFMAFDIKINGMFVNWGIAQNILEENNIPSVPCVFNGNFDISILHQLIEEPERISGKKLHISEGIVIRPVQEQIVGQNRKIAKLVSSNYLLRKNGTEYH